MFSVSAPGKTILFGEHAVVFGVPAIAASVSLRTYCCCEELPPAGPTKLELKLPDLGGDSFKFTDEELSQLTTIPSASVPMQLDPQLLAKVTNLAQAKAGDQHFLKASLVAFLYLYASIFASNPSKKAFAFSVRSALPLGAGLGSSASLSVSLAAALLKASQTIGESTPREQVLDLVNKWSFLGECCIHGNPSGIDNLVATRGGAVYFQRQPDNQPPKIKTYSNLPEINLLLTDTTVPRSTSELVSRVKATKDEWPQLFDSLLAGFDQLVSEADELLLNPQSPDFIKKMCQLIEINHGLLVTISVSHPALERVKESSVDLQLGATKLTGAGGGGCAITICNKVVKTETLNEFQNKLGPKFKVFSTELGGEGVGFSNEISNSIPELKQLKWQY